MKFPESFRRTTEKLDRIAGMTVIPSRTAIEVATENLRIANLDIERSHSEYHVHRQFDRSAKELQQGVEKTAKSWHLLAGWLSPTDRDIRRPSHEAYRLWVPNILPFYNRIREISSAVLELAESLPASNFLFRRARPMAGKAAAMTPELQPEAIVSLEQELSEMDRLHRDPETMWNASLSVDRSNKWIRYAVDSLDQPDAVSGQTVAVSAMVLRFVAVTKFLAKSTPNRISFTLALAQGMKDSLWLPLLTAWHDQPARYAAAPDSHWESRAYTESTPYVRLIPTLIEHAEKMTKETAHAAKLASKLT